MDLYCKYLYLEDKLSCQWAGGNRKCRSLPDVIVCMIISITFGQAGIRKQPGYYKKYNYKNLLHFSG